MILFAVTLSYFRRGQGEVRRVKRGCLSLPFRGDLEGSRGGKSGYFNPLRVVGRLTRRAVVGRLTNNQYQ